MSKHFRELFSPRSIAVVGATNTPGTVPNDIFTNIMRSGFSGPIYPVSPGHTAISGARAYKYVLDIPAPVDLAVIVFPSSVCKLALEQCGQMGIKAAVVISAGFKETGAKGRLLEDELMKTAAKYGISVIGPNCLGIINAEEGVRLNASFARKMPEEGEIGFLSQSGALCTAVLDYALNKHIGFSKFVSFGNKADVTEVDLLQFLLEDDKTRTILMYLEEVSLGNKLVELLREHPSSKPILALKSGRTREGGAAARSHTGSLAGSDEVCDAAFRQVGIMRAADLEEMFNHAIALTYQPLPRSNRVAIVTNAGGPGVMAADTSVESGLQLARFSEDTARDLKKALPRMANTNNPVDVIGDARADRYDASLTAVAADENVDGVVCILTPQSMTEIDSIAHLLCRVEKRMEKPLLCSLMGGADVASGVEILQRRHIPHYTLPEDACRSLAAMVRFRNWTGREAGTQKRFDADVARARNITRGCIERGENCLVEPAALELLSCYGFPLLRHGVAATAGEAAAEAERMGGPVAMKVISRDVIHKSDVGGVITGIADAAAARKAFDRIREAVLAAVPDASIEGVLIAEMAPRGKELIVGMKRDPGFGPVIMVGAGGVYVEFMKDVALRVAPLTERDAREMLEETRSYVLLSGVRGEARSDTGSVIECLLRLSQLAVDNPEITELDVNPLFVYEQGRGCRVVDARSIVQPGLRQGGSDAAGHL